MEKGQITNNFDKQFKHNKIQRTPEKKTCYIDSGIIY